MGGSSGQVVSWAEGVRVLSLCEHAGLTPVPSGVIPTVVIVSSSKTCQDGEYKGIVFYDSEPAAWYCLADDEVDKFKTWAAGTFPSVQIVTATEPGLAVSCPPPPTKVAEIDQMHDEIRKELRDLAPQWFVPATATKRVA